MCSMMFSTKNIHMKMRFWKIRHLYWCPFDKPSKNIYRKSMGVQIERCVVHAVCQASTGFAYHEYKSVNSQLLKNRANPSYNSPIFLPDPHWYTKNPSEATNALISHSYQIHCEIKFIFKDFLKVRSWQFSKKIVFTMNINSYTSVFHVVHRWSEHPLLVESGTLLRHENVF